MLFCRTGKLYTDHVQRQGFQPDSLDLCTSSLTEVEAEQHHDFYPRLVCESDSPDTGTRAASRCRPHFRDRI